MKQRTTKLDTCWTNCMSMWRWVAKMVKAGDKRSIDDLKTEWLKAHGFKDINSDCFFCHYAAQVDPNNDKECQVCPAYKVDKKFNCSNITYSYQTRPIAFYNKLRSRHRLYLKQRRAGK